jgi:hypothetical protein
VAVILEVVVVAAVVVVIGVHLNYVSLTAFNVVFQHGIFCRNPSSYFGHMTQRRTKRRDLSMWWCA